MMMKLGTRGGVSPTLNSFDNGGESRATVLIIDGTRVGDVRIYEEPVQSVIQRWGTGGGNVPIVFPIQNTVIGRSDTAGPQGKGYSDDGEPMFTLEGSGPHAVAIPIQDGRDMDKKQNGLGVGEANNPAYTVDTVSRQAVAYDEYNDSLGGDVHHSLRAGTKQSTGVLVMPTLSASNNPSRSPQSQEVTAQVNVMHEATSIVRRLTPMECERLQGFEDGWTDGQTDSHRYKQMGNAVAVPVVEWLVKRLVEG